MKWILRAVAALVLLAVAAATLQHFRYLDARRDTVHDQQAVFYPGEAFHVATVLDLHPGQDLLGSVRALVGAIETNGAEVIYAGKIAVNALVSKQISQADWDAFVLAQFPSREAYEAASRAADHVAARASFADSYALGMQRSRLLNAALPIILLGARTSDILSGRSSPYPFTRAEPADTSSDAYRVEQLAQRTRVVDGLLANRDYGQDACVVLNFTKNGTATQQAANAEYGRAMIGLMAEGGHGPMHLGAAVTLEGDADFDQVIIVYYPGVEYFADLIQSEFFTSIVGGKQLGDSQSSPSVPLLPHL